MTATINQFTVFVVIMPCLCLDLPTTRRYAAEACDSLRLVKCVFGLQVPIRNGNPIAWEAGRLMGHTASVGNLSCLFCSGGQRQSAVSSLSITTREVGGPNEPPASTLCLLLAALAAWL